MDIIIPVAVLGVLGLLFGVGLAVAARKFCIESDPRLDKVFSKLPGANCGACGMPGCMGFAEGLIKGKCSVEGCAVTEEEDRKAIAGILGVSLSQKVRTIAALHCNGGSLRVKDKHVYRGIEDCTAANLVMGGQKACIFGCLGLGTCARVCPFQAITMSQEGLPVVDKDKCRACNKCVEACPKKLFSLIPVSHTVYVACSSHDIGKDTRAVCPVGCIACKKCEQVCPYDAIHVIDNLAVIDYAKCTSCGECVKVCPVKTILIRG